LTCRASTSSRYSTGESAHKSRAAWAVSSLGVCMRERQHIYEDLNESSSASPGGSHQLEIPLSLNSKRAASIFQSRWFFTRHGDFNARQDSIVRLSFCMAPTFSKSACFSGKRQYFSNPPHFCKSANISQICLIFEKRQYFPNPPDFSKSANISQIRQIFPGCEYLYVFSVIIYAFLFVKYAPIFYWCICFDLRLKINIVVMII
jgi:hypothetical protein